MKAENKNVSAESNKPKTKYDRKMEARRLQEEKERRNAKISKCIATLVAVFLVAAAGYLIVTSVMKKNETMNDTYIMIGEEAITKHEYDFYYNSYVNQYLSTYSSILSYMGLDTTKDFASQEYSDGITWKDVFDESTVSMLTSTKSMYLDAMANGFEYDTTEDYEAFASALKSGAESAGVSVGRYYKLMYGNYATVSNVKPYMEESLIAEAYYNKLLEDNAPSADEITAHYEAYKNQYDLANYYMFAISSTTGTMSEDGSAVTEAQAKEMAYEMAERAEKEDFETLCLEYATDSEKVSYEPEDSEFSLCSDMTYSSIDSLYSDWIYDENRVEGEVAVFEDTDNLTYYIIKFVSVEYDETCVETISDNLAAAEVDVYMTELLERYEVTDVKGELKYLVTEEATEAVETEAEETVAAQ